MIRTIILTFMIMTSMLAHAQDEFFNRYEGKQDVDVAFISKGMLEAMANKGKDKTKQLENLRVMEVTNKSLIPQIKEDAFKTFSKSRGYEDLMKLNENGENTIVRKKTMKNNMSILVLISYDDDSFNVLSIKGKGLQLNDIKKMR